MRDSASVIHATKTANDGVLVATRQHQKSLDTDQDDLEGRLQGAATAQTQSSYMASYAMNAFAHFAAMLCGNSLCVLAVILCGNRTLVHDH